MNAHLEKCLAALFPFMLCLPLGGVIKCYTCNKVKMDNSCTYETHTCRGGFAEYCYTRRYILGQVAIRVERGCTFHCWSEMDNNSFIKAEVLCCKKSFCNTHDIWPEH